MKKIISLIIVCTIIISGMFIYKNDNKKTFTDDNNAGPIIAAFIDGEESTTFPTNSKYVATVECTKNGVKQNVGAKATWNGTKWVVSIDDISAGNVRCSANFISSTLTNLILTNNKVKEPLTTPDERVSDENEALLASTEDDYGTSYYFRGNVKNNYVQFANKCWRIVRITGNNSVKLVLHNDNTSNVTNPCSSVNNSDAAAFAHNDGTSYGNYFNEQAEDNAYVGFMYGTAGSSSYESTHANVNKSSILISLETWYENNLASYEDKLADTIWCNDKSTADLGYGTNASSYGAESREDSPSLICPKDKNGGNLSKFTVSDTTNGNGDLTYKIGLLTADEVIFAGLRFQHGAVPENYSTYLNENVGDDRYWWTMTPNSFAYGIAFVYFVADGALNNINTWNDDTGIRPAISLVSGIEVTSGTGTSEDPYVVN